MGNKGFYIIAPLLIEETKQIPNNIQPVSEGNLKKI
jgi:hypothetical protein